jgi:hypothetical protein
MMFPTSAALDAAIAKTGDSVAGGTTDYFSSAGLAANTKSSGTAGNLIQAIQRIAVNILT